jgi:hypothetical protein
LKPARFALAAVLLVSAAPALASDVANFLARAEVLQRRGPFALLSSDYRALKREGEAAGDELKAERVALVKAGKPTPYCPPPNGTVGDTELLNAFRAIPPAQRPHTSVKDGMRAYLARKWPCPR